MTAQTTTQRTAKHRLAVKERLQRYEVALERISGMSYPDAAIEAWDALYPTDPTKS